MKNKDNLDSKKEKKVNKIKEQLARLREKLASENKHPSLPSKSKFKKTKDKPKQPKKEEIKVKPKQPKKEEIKVKPKEAKKKEAKIKAIEKRKPKETKKKEAKIKAIEKRKAKETKKKEAKIKAIEKRKAKETKKKEAKIKAIEKRKAKETKKKEDIERKEEEKRKEEEAKKKEEEAKRTYEEELEEQLSEEEITGFQLEKTDMDKMCNRVCEIIAEHESDGIFQSQLWKKFKLSSRDGSRLALKLERMGNITREKILEKERWTYKLIIKKTPISTKSIEGAPCLTCPVEAKCSLDGEVSPKTCQWIENWVMIELKNK
jgi:hypothetical protein